KGDTGYIAEKQTAAEKVTKSKNNGNKDKGAARPFLSNPNRGPQDERQWQKEDGGKEAGGRKSAGCGGGNNTNANERHRQHRRLDVPARGLPSRPPRAVRKPDQEHRTEREIGKRIGEVPMGPEDPVVCERTAAQDRHERAA